MDGPAWERCQANSNRREILDERRTARTSKQSLRQLVFPADIDVSELRRLLRELTSAQPLPPGGAHRTEPDS